MIQVTDKAKIKTKELNFQLYDKASTDVFVQSLDYVPLVFISKLYDTNNPPLNGTTIDPSDIISIKLFNDKFLPSVELFCEDSLGVIFTDFYPYDHDTIISVFVKSNSEQLMPLRMDFRLTELQTIKSDPDSHGLQFLIKGILDVDELQYSNYEAINATSYQAIKQLALRMNLGFASNIQDSADSMKWINPSDVNQVFIKDITKYSYVSDQSFVWTFIDFYYNLNYIDVQAELNSVLKDESQSLANPQLEKNPDEKNVLLYLTNNDAFKGTNQYFTTFNIVNQSYSINLELAYQTFSTWYTKNNNTVTKKLITDLETDENKVGSKLKILKDKQSGIFSGNINDEYFIGKMDNENVHENYNYAKLSNQYNLISMERMKLVLTLDVINFSIKRFQNIKVEVFNSNDLFSSNANTKKPLNNINTKLSGYWYVTGINYIFKYDEGVEQEITLMRRDLNIDYGNGNNEQHDLSAAATSNNAGGTTVSTGPKTK